jgi:hypothetical protein
MVWAVVARVVRVVRTRILIRLLRWARFLRNPGNLVNLAATRGSRLFAVLHPRVSKNMFQCRLLKNLPLIF